MLNIHTNFQALTSADGTQSSPLKVLWNVKCSAYQSIVQETLLLGVPWELT